MLIMLAYKTNHCRICKNNIEAEQEISRCDIIRDISFNFIARLMGSLDKIDYQFTMRFRCIKSVVVFVTILP